METKGNETKRAILTYLIQAYGNKPKRIIIEKAKLKGVYSLETTDEEVYELISKFAEYHKMPFGYVEKEKVIKEETIEELNEENLTKKEEVNEFYNSLLKERDIISVRLLALNKLITAYEKS